MAAGESTGTSQVVYIRYVDSYERRGREWLIVERQISMLWSEDVPAYLPIDHPPTAPATPAPRLIVTGFRSEFAIHDVQIDQPVDRMPERTRNRADRSRTQRVPELIAEWLLATTALNCMPR